MRNQCREGRDDDDGDGGQVNEEYFADITMTTVVS